MTSFVAVLLLVAAAPAVAESWSIETGPTAGVTVLDPALGDYRWDIRPGFQAGLEGAVGRGPWRLGVRLSRSQTTQGTGLGAGYDDPTVRLSSAQLAVRRRLVRPLGLETWLTGHAGWLHLGYTPDRLDLAAAGLTVDYKPLDEFVAGGGLRLRRPLGRHWAVALSGEASTFALDTSHRRGDSVVHRRERFWNWSARLTVAWRLTLG